MPVREGFYIRWARASEVYDVYYYSEEEGLKVFKEKIGEWGEDRRFSSPLDHETFEFWMNFQHEREVIVESPGKLSLKVCNEETETLLKCFL